jgi:hypothetical protein
VNEPHCNKLEDYLDGALPQSKRLAFGEHLAICSACAAAVHEHEQVMYLLRRAVETETGPTGLIQRIEGQWRIRKRRRLLWASGAAASLLVLCLTSWPAWRGALTPRVSRSIADKPITGNSLAFYPSRPDVQATFPPDAHVIAVRPRSHRANVTVVWVYTGAENYRAPTPSRKTPTIHSERSFHEP